ncbi:hypothetical protein DL770_011244 [Monosporascus sp. CRB-9-2]|nr:hypothetical protein DL770_011244 [Monosporascus sp. CRB-9-2]
MQQAAFAHGVARREKGVPESRIWCAGCGPGQCAGVGFSADIWAALRRRDTEEGAHIGVIGNPSFHQTDHARRVFGRKPERALAALVCVEKARLAIALFAPAGLHAPVLPVAKGAADHHALRAGVRHSAAQVGQAHQRLLRRQTMRVGQAHEQPQALERGASAVDGLRRSQFHMKWRQRGRCHTGSVGKAKAWPPLCATPPVTGVTRVT